jgi:hypothetical protein
MISAILHSEHHNYNGDSGPIPRLWMHCNFCLFSLPIYIMVTLPWQDQYFLFIFAEKLRKLPETIRGTSVDDKEKSGPARAVKIRWRLSGEFSFSSVCSAKPPQAANSPLRKRCGKCTPRVIPSANAPFKNTSTNVHFFFAGVRRDESQPIGWWW